MRRFLFLILGILMSLAWVSPANVASSAPVVQAIFLYSPSCSACRQVTTGILPPLRAKYGAQLGISMLDTSTAKGQPVLQNVVQKYNIPSNRQSEPILIVGSSALVGIDDIRNKFSGLIDAGLTSGGVAWPDIPGLKDALAVDTTQFGNGAVGEVTATDALANYLAMALLVIMLAVVGLEIYRRPWENRKNKSKAKGTAKIPGLAWAIPVLVLVGLIISIYLSYIELTATQAVCGPVGNCNAVQQSSYARLFGILPVGVLGAFGNLCIIGAWIFKYYGPSQLRAWATLGLAGFVSFGILFSIYLTFLEPFVIEATCAWCLGSAVVMTAMFWISLETAWK